MEKIFYAVFSPWGQNGYYFGFIIAENGNVLHICYGKNLSRAIREANKIAIKRGIEKIDMLDMDKPNGKQKLQELMRTCDEKSLNEYRFHGLFHS